MAERQEALGDALFGTPMQEASQPPQATADLTRPDLDEIQADSEKQALPDQEKLFRIAKRVRSKLHNLPDPARPPLGFVPGRGFDVVFPFIKLPHLAPNLNGDWVQFGSPDLEPNRLYYGDNLQVLRTLPSNSIDLIYIDPPFFSGAEYNVIWGDTNEVRTFSDIWEGGLDTYLIWLNARLWEMRRVLKTTGSIFVHCDWHASHYIKAELDKIFGYENFRNEIIWRRTGSHNAGRKFGPVHDTLLFYTKGKKYRFERTYTPYLKGHVDSYFKQSDERGRYWTNALTGKGLRGGLSGKEWRGFNPSAHGRHWAIPGRVVDGLGIDAELNVLEKLEALSEAGFVRFPADGSEAMPTYVQYLDSSPGQPVGDIWAYQPHTSGVLFGTDDEIDKGVRWLNNQGDAERIGYPTQKPEALLARVIQSTSEHGGVVADFFCGGGATVCAAQRLARRWIACDSSRVAISVTLDRLVKLGEEQSGVMSNYGKSGTVQAKLDLPETKGPVPDMRVYYVGVYPMDRFNAVDQPTFENFVLACLAAQADNSEATISGWRSAREPIKVGPAGPDAAPDPKEVQAFFESVLTKLEPNVRTIARYVCWRTSPELMAYRKKLSDYVRRNVQPRGADLDFDFLLIDSEEFRERIRQKYPDADDNEFLLRFTKEPVVGSVIPTRVGPRRYRFEARDADSTNTGGYLVNCQWDFDYQRGHFAADSKYILGRVELKGKDAKGRKFDAVLTAEHIFETTGTCTIACRVQDNLGAETIRSISIEVS